MAAGRDRPELTRSYEGQSLFDFDRGFCTDRSLSLSAVSDDSFLRPNKGNTLGTALRSPVEGKSSTPYKRVKFQKPIQASSLDQSCVDLTTTHPSWEVSLVKAIVESPKSCLESTWSPINLSAPPEVSMIWSGTSPHPNVSEELQRSWKEMVWQGSGQVPAIPNLREEQNSSNLAI
ncbi:uncharacterized protein si:ch73-303b9.1 isoform X2 [Labeo rohita]|uniref:uncharacterized protein si:ch73-303b9.1 isoform X2 n=1 Tax=Labeo rohita TaxID=84645 RepID=UPI0021E29A71|nr:uncharacterized protein si:ch73-303b9.1 isoform X2 [Labeo rohita]